MASISGKRIVITGGAGFIGSSLAHALKDDNELVVIDDLSTGRRENLQGGEDIAFVQGTIEDQAMVKGAMEGAEIVFHQAAMASVQKSIEDPVHCARVNVSGTLNVLVAARDAGARKVVFASSSAVYGDTDQVPTTEEVQLAPLSPYAASKIAGENFCRSFGEVYGLETVCLRYFNVYGPRQDPHSEYSAVIPKFMHLAAEGRPLQVFGSGDQVRDFVFISDVVEANVLAATSSVGGGEQINVGRGVAVSVNDIASEIGELVGGVLVEHGEARSGEIFRSVASVEKARRFLGFEARVDVRAGLGNMRACLSGHQPR